MKIILATPYVPQPFGETSARWFYVLIKGLLAKGHQVVCLTASEEKPHIVQEASERLTRGNDTKLDFRFFPMQPDSNVLRRKWRNLLRPFGELLYVDGLPEALQTELRKGYDILHLETLWTGWLGFDIPRSLLNIHCLPTIDWAEKRLSSLAEIKAYWQMKRATDAIVKQTTNISVLSHRLLAETKSINPKARCWVAPTGLDPTLYDLQPIVKEPVVGLIGSMFWEPSQSAAKRLLTRIWPLVKKQVPKAKLLIAGWNAKKYLGEFLPLADVILEENLSHPTDFFSRVRVLVYAPSRGSGMKVKVMESMLYGVPVVTTWEGVEGIEYEDGENCLVAENDGEIAERTAFLLRDSDQWINLRMQARLLIEEKYSPGVTVEKRIKIYEQI